jgi:RimJ/RimL family protein N-acetyltransferase
VSAVYDVSQTAIASNQRDRRKRAGGCYEIVVADSARVCVRGLEPADRDGLARVFERLSERSRTQRFLGPKRQLTDRDLSRLSNIDHVRHEALVAIDPADGSIIGVARYCKWSGRAGVAELAGEIVDDWQGRGIGGELLARIIERAGVNDIHKLTASAFSDNAAALALLRRAGFTTTRRGYGVSELQLELVPPNHHRSACIRTELDAATSTQPQLEIGAGCPDCCFRRASGRPNTGRRHDRIARAASASPTAQ